MTNDKTEVLYDYKGCGGKFFILVDNKEAAEMAYSYVGLECIIIDYTYIDEILDREVVSKKR